MAGSAWSARPFRFQNRQVVGHDGENESAPEPAKRGLAQVFPKPITADVIARDMLATVASGQDAVVGTGALEV